MRTAAEHRKKRVRGSISGHATTDAKKALLCDQLKQLLAGRVCVLGVGNRCRRDDGAGSLLAEHLGRRTGAAVIDAGAVPENYLEKVARSHPDTILIIDAVDFAAAAGDQRIFEPESIALAGFSTHALTLRLAADFLKARTQARVALLAIQPADIGWGVGLSKEVSRAVGLVEESLLAILGRSTNEQQASRVIP